MSHWQAMGRCIGKNGEEIAEELNLEYSTVRRWTRPYDGPMATGARGPGEKVYKTIRRSLELRTPPEDAFAPLDEIETLLGRVCIETFPTNKSIKELVAELGTTMKESGEALAVSANALANGTLSHAERVKVLKENKEALRAWATFILEIERAGK